MTPADRAALAERLLCAATTAEAYSDRYAEVRSTDLREAAAALSAPVWNRERLARALYEQECEVRKVWPFDPWPDKVRDRWLTIADAVLAAMEADK